MGQRQVLGRHSNNTRAPVDLIVRGISSPRSIWKHHKLAIHGND